MEYVVPFSNIADRTDQTVSCIGQGEASGLAAIFMYSMLAFCMASAAESIITTVEETLLRNLKPHFQITY
jgi:hypothetical protein